MKSIIYCLIVFAIIGCSNKTVLEKKIKEVLKTKSFRGVNGDTFHNYKIWFKIRGKKVPDLNTIDKYCKTNNIPLSKDEYTFIGKFIMHLGTNVKGFENTIIDLEEVIRLYRKHK